MRGAAFQPSSARGFRRVMGRGCGWTLEEEIHLKGLLASGLGVTAIASQTGWNLSTIKKAKQKVLGGIPLVYTRAVRKTHNTVRNAEFVDSVRDILEQDKKQSLAQVRARLEEFGVSVSRSTIQRTIRQDLQKKSLKCIRGHRLAVASKAARLAWCSRVHMRASIHEGLRSFRLVGKLRGLDLERVLWTDEKIFRYNVSSIGSFSKICSRRDARSGGRLQFGVLVVLVLELRPALHKIAVFGSTTMLRRRLFQGLSLRAARRRCPLE